MFANAQKGKSIAVVLKRKINVSNLCFSVSLLLHDQEILTVELDLGARPFPEQNGVADLEIDRDQLAGLVTATRADCGDLTLARLFLGGIGNDRIATRTTSTRKTYMLPSSSCP